MEHYVPLLLFDYIDNDVESQSIHNNENYYIYVLKLSLVSLPCSCSKKNNELTRVTCHSFTDLHITNQLTARELVKGSERRI